MNQLNHTALHMLETNVCVWTDTKIRVIFPFFHIVTNPGKLNGREDLVLTTESNKVTIQSQKLNKYFLCFPYSLDFFI